MYMNSPYGEVGLADLFAPVPIIRHRKARLVRLQKHDVRGVGVQQEKQKEPQCVDKKQVEQILPIKSAEEKSILQERVIPIETHGRGERFWAYGVSPIQELK